VQPHERFLTTLRRIAAAATQRDDHGVALSAASNALSISVRAVLRSPEDRRRREVADTCLEAVTVAAQAAGRPQWAIGQIEWARRSLASTDVQPESASRD
jgi:hypothetical protein